MTLGSHSPACLVEEAVDVVLLLPVPVLGGGVHVKLCGVILVRSRSSSMRRMSSSRPSMSVAMTLMSTAAVLFLISVMSVFVARSAVSLLNMASMAIICGSSGGGGGGGGAVIALVLDVLADVVVLEEVDDEAELVG